MKTKILIILIILVGLGTGGFFVWKNITAPEVEKEKIEEKKTLPAVQEEIEEVSKFKEEPEEELLTKSCSASCDDEDSCTRDFCSEETNYRCVHENLSGAQAGCSGSAGICREYLCSSGACITQILDNCCGNGKCESGETYKECAGDCVKTGNIEESEVWGGTIHVTGDIDVIEGVTLTILPGTVIEVALTDDQNKGRDEPMTDIYFPKDPPFYEKQKITITIRGILNAIGTPDNKIIFTSVSENPTTYDWRGIDIFHGKLEHAIVEYGQGNIQIQHSSDVVLSNNIIRNSLSCCICIGHSNQLSPQILNNDVYNCGHETIDYAGGSALIKGNYFHLENPEIQPDPSRCGGGIIVYKNTYPTIEDNVFEKLPNAITFLNNSLYEEEEGKKVILRNNRIENNNVGIRINPGYPEDVIIEENNQLINNEEDRLYL